MQVTKGWLRDEENTGADTHEFKQEAVQLLEVGVILSQTSMVNHQASVGQTL